MQAFGEMIRPLPGAETRKMFGYPAAFYNGQMFAGLFQESMFLRLGSDDRAAFLALPGSHVFAPMAGRPMREYVVVPEAMLAAPADLAPWLDRALAYAAALPPKPEKARTSKLKKAKSQ